MYIVWSALLNSNGVVTSKYFGVSSEHAPDPALAEMCSLTFLIVLIILLSLALLNISTLQGKQ